MAESKIERLEEKIEHLEEKRLETIESQLSTVIKNQRVFEKELERYRARWGLVLMVGSALLATVKLFWEDLHGWLTRH